MTIEKAQIVDYQKAPAAASVMHIQALHLLQLDLLGQVELAAPLKIMNRPRFAAKLRTPVPQRRPARR
jgi:hypothetical protein